MNLELTAKGFQKGGEERRGREEEEREERNEPSFSRETPRKFRSDDDDDEDNFQASQSLVVERARKHRVRDGDGRQKQVEKVSHRVLRLSTASMSSTLLRSLGLLHLTRKSIRAVALRSDRYKRCFLHILWERRGLLSHESNRY